jgi:hypothetical protein
MTEPVDAQATRAHRGRARSAAHLPTITMDAVMPTLTQILPSAHSNSSARVARCAVCSGCTRSG